MCQWTDDLAYLDALEVHRAPYLVRGEGAACVGAVPYPRGEPGVDGTWCPEMLFAVLLLGVLVAHAAR